MTSLSELSVDELADGICLRAGRIAAAQAELLLWIAEFDRREGWGRAGMLSCAHWLSWRVGLSLGTARDQVRVARRLEELPQVAAAFGDGRVSYSKVRAITRVAEDGDGVDWVELARHSSPAQLDKIVRGVRRARANEAASADPEAAAWVVRTRVRYDDNGSFVLTISGPAQFLPVVRAGLDAKKAELQRERDAAAEDDQGGHDQGGTTTLETRVGCPSLLQRREVGDVLRTSTGSLVSAQVVQRDEGHRQTIDNDFDTMVEAPFELDAVDRRQQVDSDGRVAQLHHTTRLGEIVRDQADGPEAEMVQCREQAFGVLRGSPDPQIEVAGVTRMTVSSHGIAPDDQVADNHVRPSTRETL
jgi:hypothetical protein